MIDTTLPQPLPTSLPVTRYRFTAVMQQPLQLPNYAGSLLRGQFGAALRSVACMTRAPTCPGCPLLQTCPYSRIFEAPAPPKGQHSLQNFSQIPNPYIVEPPAPGARLLAAGDLLVFNLVLVGHAIDQLALIIFALQRALAQGLTRERVPAQLVQVDHLNAAQQAHSIWHLECPTLAEHSATITLPSPENAPSATPDATQLIAAQAYSTRAAGTNGTSISLQLHTPLRLQRQGQPLGVGQLTPRALVATLARRIALLMEFHGGASNTSPAHPWGEAAKAITHLSESLTDTQDLHWVDWTRYSSRQQQEMTLGGVLGRWTLHAQDPATLAAIRPWLWLGQWLHVGKNATMGMGGYTVEASLP